MARNNSPKRREERRARAQARLAAHVYGRGCGKNCPKRPDFKAIAKKFGDVTPAEA